MKMIVLKVKKIFLIEKHFKVKFQVELIKL